MSWYNASWQYRVKVTVQAGQVDTDQNNYVVYVDLSDLPAGFHTNVNQTDGRDIRVTSSDGETEIPREVVFYDSSIDGGELYFKGYVDGDTNTDFYIYYGNASATEPAVTSTYGRNNVWTDYYRVYHLQANFTDSSGNLDGTNYSSSDIAGKIEKGRDFSGGTSNQRVEYGAVNKTDNFTLQHWINPDTVSEADQRFGGAATSVTGHSVLAFRLLNAGVQIWDGAWKATGQSLSIDSWQHLSFNFGVASGGFLNLGTQKNGGAVSNITATQTTWGLNRDDFSFAGRYATYGTSLNGQIDEFRVSKNVLSTSRTTTDYNNQSSPSTFYSVGTQETGGYKTPQYLYWTKINSGTKNILQVIVHERDVTTPDDSSIDWHVSADGGSNWEAVTAEVAHDIVNAGNDLRVRATLNASTDLQSSPTLNEVSFVWTEQQAVDVNDEISAKVSGVDTTSSEVDSRVTGKQSTSSTINAKTTGKQTANSEISGKLTGQDTTSSEIPTKTVGKDSATNEIPVKLKGKDTTQFEVSSKITGQDSSSSEISAKLTGIPIPADDEIPAKVTGKDISQSEIASKLTGKQTDTSEIQVKVRGKYTASSEISVKLRGGQADTSETSSKLTGQDLAQSEKQAKVTGKNTTQSEISSALTGKQTDSDEVNAKLSGIDTTHSEIDTRVTGKLTTNSGISAKLIGIESSEVSAKLTGKVCITYDTEFIFVDGKLCWQVKDNIYTKI